VIKNIEKLPEFKFAANRLSPDLAMTVGPKEWSTALLHHGRCYLSVPVYVDRADRLEMWHIFLVNKSGRVVYVQDADGEYINIRVWRKRENQKQAHLGMRVAHAPRVASATNDPAISALRRSA
jgi:hypothetical protein